MSPRRTAATNAAPGPLHGLGHFVRALEIIRARDKGQLPAATRAEARSIADTSAWFHDSPGVVGMAIGRGYRRGKPRPQRCIQVFVDRKLPPDQLARTGRAPITAPTVRGRRIPIDVIEVGAPVLHAGIGSPIGAGSPNVGSLGALLEDTAGALYGLSAAHVLCESYTGGGGRRPHIRGDAILDYSPGNGSNAGARPIGRLFDRALLDFTNLFPDQSLDAAIFRFDGVTSSQVPRDQLPYSGVDWPHLGDSVSVLGAASGGAGAPGEVVSLAADLIRQVAYADPSGQLRGIQLTRLVLSDASSDHGDSGGAVVRSDGALVGLHLGAMPFRFRDQSGNIREEQKAFCIDIRRALARWHTLRLITA